MPIVDGMVEYDLPEWVRDKITYDFAKLVVDEARKLFNTRGSELLYSDASEKTGLLYFNNPPPISKPVKSVCDAAAVYTYCGS